MGVEGGVLWKALNEGLNISASEGSIEIFSRCGGKNCMKMNESWG